MAENYFDSIPVDDAPKVEAPNATMSEGNYFDDIPTEQEVDQVSEIENDTLLTELNSAMMKIPFAPELLEFSSGVNRGVSEIVDFLGTDTVNAILNVGGSELRLPRLSEEIPGIQGGFVESGLTKDILSESGEIIPSAVGLGMLLRKSAVSLLPAFSQGESATVGAVRQIAQTTPAQEAIYGSASAAGGEIGRQAEGDTGQLVGSILAPTVIAGVKSPLQSLVAKGKAGIDALINGTKGMSEKGASRLLADAMVRENLSVDDVAKALDEMGDDAVLADVGDSFRRILRLSSNEIPRIQGRARADLDMRQSGQQERIGSALNDSTGTSNLTLTDEIVRMNNSTKPEISRLYSEAEQVSAEMPDNTYVSKWLTDQMSADNSIGEAYRKAQRNLRDVKALGDRVTKLTEIDETKKVLDDDISSAIRNGRNQDAMRLIRLKNQMVSEVDQAIPQYKQARDMFAGSKAVEGAADVGEQFFKLKPREIEEAIGSYGDSEKKFFVLGAKRAILDRMDNINANADLVKRLFGKNGDARKLRPLFENDESFNKFMDGLKTESEFVLTRRAAQGNSTTAQQFTDIGNASDVIDGTRAILGDPQASVSMFSRILSGFMDGATSQQKKESLEKAGDVLLTTGRNIDEITRILKNGSVDEIQTILNQTLLKPNFATKTAVPITAETLNEVTE